MRKEGVAAFIVPSTDPHAGEYVPAHWETRSWISGFTGSAGTAVITLTHGGVWTDSRYFLQAAEQLEGTGLDLLKDRLPATPSIADWLESLLQPGDKVGIDGWVNTVAEVNRLREELGAYGIELVTIPDPFDTLWTDRPALPAEPVFILPKEYTGRSCSDKLSCIRRSFLRNGADSILLSALDEIAWTLNLRGSDVHCNPVFLAYLFVEEEKATLYTDESRLTAEVKDYLKEKQVHIRPYTAIEADLKMYDGSCIQLSPSTNYALYQTAAAESEVVVKPSPVSLMKAVKNEVEIAGFHEAMKRDGVAMVRFLMWLEQAVKSGRETEVSIDRKLYELRAEQALFKGISFDTIAGYQAHGAIVHYEATPESASTLKPEGILLLDSGAQYLDGTTDITRTIPLGHVSEAQREDYTLVLKGFIQLSLAVFPEGTCGTQLDVLARSAMWKAGINYGHGTGHGVGHFLNVHEGPHQIRMNYMPTPLQPGMTVTNEPGIYKAGQYGIRTENTMLIVEDRETEFGHFYRFEPLTLCPINTSMIIAEQLTNEEIAWLNGYHARVYRILSPLLDEAERKWLQKATTHLPFHHD